MSPAKPLVSLLSLTALLSASNYLAAEQKPSSFAQQCARLSETQLQVDQKPVRITQAVYQDAETAGPNQPVLPAHCDIQGSFAERQGMDGQSYAIKFHLRLPQDWNGGLFFQGGGGLNGHRGDAIGHAGQSTPALVRGYAVVSQDSGHDAATNSDPQKGGEAAFGFDFEARKNYAHASIVQTHQVASRLVNTFYGQTQKRSYFYGCSKGGQEGMIAAQRYPELFDGIVVVAPGISLPKAAIAQTWDTQAFASLLPEGAKVRDLGKTFSDKDLNLVSEAFLAACDKLDGIDDGMIQQFAACTKDRVYPALEEIQCVQGKNENCLSSDQITAIKKSFAGPKNSRGEALYSAFPFDAGISDFGWRIWKLGNDQIPSLNVVLGMPALSSLFSTPPKALEANPNWLLAQQLTFDFDKDAEKIFATSSQFPESPWQLMQATSPDLDKFKARGSKLILAHGVSDPVFSVLDSIAWWNAVDERYQGKAQDFARLFAVPGMGHCQGGPATDQFDALSALIDWVENARAPESLNAKAGPASPWPGRERQLCVYPAALTYEPAADGKADGQFVCR